MNVGGLIASTRDISNDDIIAGRWRFNGSGNGAVLNQGSITADGGFVALLGARVANDGTISARWAPSRWPRATPSHWTWLAMACST